ncbi:MAG TPA: hypothetical protein VMG08_04840 [Allosphingosinicella sp.]|nr:hypothetical protein [Allosphingosinicella sp.]
MLAVVAALSLQAHPLPAAPAAPAGTADPCPVDRRAMLDLGINAFDQDHQGGWRPLSDRPGCAGAAADLIRDYRTFVLDRIPILYWHEGQLRAEAGQNEEAARLMDRTRRAAGDPRAPWWNAYVDATIAFLRGDRAGLVQARARLAAVPRAADWPAGQAWPPNLRVVDGLVACFGRPYRDAYGTPACLPAATP